MERDLIEICGLRGVAGAFVCDNAGEIIACSNPPALATVTMTQVGRVAAQVFGAMEAANRRVDRLEVAYDSGRLFARDLGSALLVVICQPGVDSAMLRMAVDVAVVGWRNDNQQRKRLSRSKVARRHVLTRPELDDVAWQSWRVLAPGA